MGIEKMNKKLAHKYYLFFIKLKLATRINFFVKPISTCATPDKVYILLNNERLCDNLDNFLFSLYTITSQMFLLVLNRVKADPPQE